MKKSVLGGILVLLVVSAGVAAWWYWDHSSAPEKPPMWGLSDPPASANLTWVREGRVQIANATLSSAPSFYGTFEEQLLDLGYSMDMGNWSSTECQWSVWSSYTRNRTYYIAYSGSRFLGIRGSYMDVMDAASRKWLCQDPSNATPIATPSPESEARALSLQLGKLFMDQGFSVGPANWSGPMPDWYLGKFSFHVGIGKGVEVLVLTYVTRDQAEYAVHQLERDRTLGILKDYGGQYYSIIVLMGEPNDVKTAMNLIKHPPSEVPSPPSNRTGNSS